ncbi:N-acetyldiaminopimelate deacetylase [Bacillus sp. 2205SS5-2]|uniref:N-acetyldiaminopimelate deacetylase n=1 Tax=Bacillus sp. 2205SS5-2 TaxID=3109031 RepID=UPI003007E3B4
MNSQFIHIRRDLHKIPEKGFREYKTQAYLLNYLGSLPQERIEIKKWKTGLLVKVRGSEGAKSIGYRADMDGLPIEEATNLDFQSDHPGYMHACGHDFHMSIALGVLTHFVNFPIHHHMIFLFQPAEEGPGGAEPLLNSEEFKEWMPDIIMALHIAPEYPVGTVAVREGLLFANTSELFIDFKGKGGHAAYPHQTKDMILASSTLVTQLQSIVSRNIDPLESVVVTIGKMTAGTVQNVIAENARLEGTIRTLAPHTMTKVKNRIESLVKGIELAFECSVSIDYGSNYYQVFNEEKNTSHFMEFVESYKEASLVICQEAMTGEDFGYMLKEIPGFMFWLGVDTPYGLHHSRLNPKEEAIDFAIGLLTEYIESI